MADHVAGVTRTVDTQEEIMAAVVKSNLRRQLQIVGTTFQQPALIYAFGLCADDDAWETQKDKAGLLVGW